MSLALALIAIAGYLVLDDSDDAPSQFSGGDISDLSSVLGTITEFDAASTRAELADKSDVVTIAVLVDTVDGRVFGDSADDPLAGRYIRLVFMAEPSGETFYVELSRPGESPSLEIVQSHIPIGVRSVIYLEKARPISEESRPFWFNVPDDDDYYFFTTPQGWILEYESSVIAPLSTARLDVPSSAELAAWLPE